MPAFGFQLVVLYPTYHDCHAGYGKWETSLLKVSGQRVVPQGVGGDVMRSLVDVNH